MKENIKHFFQNKTNRLVAMLLSICMVLSMIPTFALQIFAAGNEIGGALRTTTLDLTTKDYQSEKGVVNKGTIWTNDSEGWSYDTKTLTLTLSGVNIKTEDSATGNCKGIALPTDATMTLTKDTDNIVCSGNATGTDMFSYAIWASPNLIINGEGTLQTTGGKAYKSYGIYAISSINLQSGTVIATGGTATYSSYGIGSDSVITIEGGKVIATGGEAENSYGIDGSECVIVNAGTVIATGGTSTYQSCGIAGASGAIFDGGTVTATAGTVTGEEVDWKGSFGIYSIGGIINISGGTVTATGGTSKTKSYGINARNTYKNINISGGLTIARSGTANSSQSTNKAVTVKENTALLTGSNTAKFAVYDDSGKYYVIDSAAAAPAGATGHTQISGTTGLDYKDSTSDDVANHITWVNRTLTLKNVIINVDKLNPTSATYGIKLPTGATLTLEGVNIVRAGDTKSNYSYGINTNDKLSINGNGTLHAIGGSSNYYSYGIYAGSLSLSGVDVTGIGGTTNNYSFGIYALNGSIDISGGTVTAIGGTATDSSYGFRVWTELNILDGTVTAVGGTASYSYGIYGSDESELFISGGTGTVISGTAKTSKAFNKEPTFLNRCKIQSGAWDSNVATWGLPTCKIIWDDGSTSPTTTCVAQGADITLPDVPTKKNYNFGGWWTKQNGKGTQIIQSVKAPIEDSVTYYARWYVTPELTGGTVRKVPLDLTNTSYQEGATQNGAIWTNDKEGWSYNEGTKVLTLSGVNFVTAYIPNAARANSIVLPAGATIHLEEHTVNTLHTRGTDGYTEASYTIHALSDLTINGEGTLQLTGTITCLAAQGNIIIQSGTVIATAGSGTVNRSIYSAKDIIVEGGTVIAHGGDIRGGKAYGIYADEQIIVNDGTVNAFGGWAVEGNSYGMEGYKGVTINGGTVNAFGGSSYHIAVGISSFNDINFKGGTVTASGGSIQRGLSVDEGSWGVLSQQGTINISGGTVTASGGLATENDPSCKPSSYGINVKDTTKSINISGGLLIARSGRAATSQATNKAITTKGNMALLTGSNTAKYAVYGESGKYYVIDNKSGTKPAGATGYTQCTEDAGLDYYGIAPADVPNHISWDIDTKTLTLKNVIVNNDAEVVKYEYEGIRLPQGEVTLLLEGTNVISSGIDPADREAFYGIYCYGQLTIKETENKGTLHSLGYTVGSDKNSLSCGIYATRNIYIESGTITAMGGMGVGSTYGIRSYDSIVMSGGTVNAIAGIGAKTYNRENYSIYARYGFTISGGTGNALNVSGASIYNTSTVFRYSPSSLNGYGITNGAWDSYIATLGLISKTNPVITTAPTASDISYGQTLASSTLTDGVAKVGNTVVEGSFKWIDSTTELTKFGIAEYEVIFTPNDTIRYNSISSKANVKVKKANNEIKNITDIQKRPH